MKNFSYRASKMYLLLMIPLYILIAKIQAAFHIVNDIPNYLMTIVPLLGLLAILGLLLTVPNLSAAIKVWKGILWVSFLLIALPVIFLILPVLVFPNSNPEGVVLAFPVLVGLVIFDGPVILLGIIGLLVSENRAKGKLNHAD